MRFLHLSVIIFLSCTILRAQDSSITIMSYNIRLPHLADGIHYWDNRRPLVVATIQFHEVDILGVQEAYRRQLDEMVADMPQYEWFGVSRTDGTIAPNPDNEFSAILYRKDRFTRLDGNTFWLSKTPEIAGSVGWDAALPRIVTWAKFKDKVSGYMFFHFNTHFDHIGTEARTESAKLLLKNIEIIAGNMPVVITGDFNCGETDLPYLTLTNINDRYHLTDALHASHFPHYGPLATFAGSFMESGLNDHRIDFIFIQNNINVIKHGILATSWHGRLASDHLPVLAKIKMPN